MALEPVLRYVVLNYQGGKRRQQAYGLREMDFIKLTFQAVPKTQYGSTG
jgi:hypothetical protein